MFISKGTIVSVILILDIVEWFKVQGILFDSWPVGRCKLLGVQPVCGINGVTYKNRDCATEIGIKIIFKGPCKSKRKPQKDCPYDYDPVCGSDGVTYKNFHCVKEGVRIVSLGPCPPIDKDPGYPSTTKPPTTVLSLETEEEEDDCPYQYDPVCGSDGVTYKNFRCVKKGVRIDSVGPCPPVDKITTVYPDTTMPTTSIIPETNEDCPDDYDPVCGDDGVTYKNFLCVKEGVRIVSLGPCPPADNDNDYPTSSTSKPPTTSKKPKKGGCGCDCDCKSNSNQKPTCEEIPYLPVCGANGVTYNHSRCVDEGIQIVSIGPCPDVSKLHSKDIVNYRSTIDSSPCPYSYAPVCGNDDVTYKNRRCVKLDVRVISRGPCPSYSKTLRTRIIS